MHQCSLKSHLIENQSLDPSFFVVWALLCLILRSADNRCYFSSFQMSRSIFRGFCWHFSPPLLLSSLLVCVSSMMWLFWTGLQERDSLPLSVSICAAPPSFRDPCRLSHASSTLFVAGGVAARVSFASDQHRQQQGSWKTRAAARLAACQAVGRSTDLHSSLISCIHISHLPTARLCCTPITCFRFQTQAEARTE